MQSPTDTSCSPILSSFSLMPPSYGPITPRARTAEMLGLPPSPTAPWGAATLSLGALEKVRGCFWGRGFVTNADESLKVLAPGMPEGKSFSILMGKRKIWFTISPPPAVEKTFSNNPLLRALICPDAAAGCLFREP